MHIAFPPCYSNNSRVPKANAQAWPTRRVRKVFLFEGLDFLHSDFDDSLSIIISGFQQRTGGEMSLVPIRSRAYESQGAVTISGPWELVPIWSVPRGTDHMGTNSQGPEIVTAPWDS